MPTISLSLSAVCTDQGSARLRTTWHTCQARWQNVAIYFGNVILKIIHQYQLI